MIDVEAHRLLKTEAHSFLIHVLPGATLAPPLLGVGHDLASVGTKTPPDALCIVESATNAGWVAFEQRGRQQLDEKDACHGRGKWCRRIVGTDQGLGCVLRGRRGGRVSHEDDGGSRFMEKRCYLCRHLGVATERERQQSILGPHSNQTVGEGRFARLDAHHIRQHRVQKKIRVLRDRSTGTLPKHMDPPLTRLEQGCRGVKAGRRRVFGNRPQVALDGFQPAVDERARPRYLWFVVATKTTTDTGLQCLLKPTKTAIPEAGPEAYDRGLRNPGRGGQGVGRAKGNACGVTQDRLGDALVVWRELLESIANAIQWIFALLGHSATVPDVVASPQAGRYGSAMARIFSGIQPTGDKHIGNYLGAIRHWVTGQSKHDCLYSIVDLHSITVPVEPAALREATLSLATLLFAAGLDPAKSTLFAQSHVSEHMELAWYLNCTATMGELRRMTQFKDKSGGQESVSVGLFDYPVLQAADVLLYQAGLVPVGEDQRQHLELMRDIAIRFNSRYGDTFVVPQAQIPPTGARIVDLQEPTKKMSTTGGTEQGTLLLLDSPARLRKKVMSAVTDSDGVVRADLEHKPGITGLLSLLSAIEGVPIASLEERYDGKGYGDFKTDVAEAVVALLEPLQARHAELASDPGEVVRLLKIGADHARSLAVPTVELARERIGFAPRG